MRFEYRAYLLVISTCLWIVGRQRRAFLTYHHVEGIATLNILPRNVIGLYLKAGKIRTLAGIALLIPVIAFIDWGVGDKVSLGVLYIIPMMLGASVLNPLETAGAATLCAF